MPSARTGASRKSWTWRRWVAASEQETWIGKLEAAGCASWVFTERPGRVRILLEVYLESSAAARVLSANWGGRVASVDQSAWFKPRPAPPTRIGRLEIIHEKSRSRQKTPGLRLHIPHGLAFGSGEHGTTYMLLRELTRQGEATFPRLRVLDLGTGSGVLALAARLLGARKIVATDFDPDAIRTARENEALNFSAPEIRWQTGDVKKLRAKARYDLVLANLFSGILSDAAAQIAGSVAPEGELWMSGILESQRQEVVAAYRGQSLQLKAAKRRGKWVLLQWAKLAGR